MSEDRRSPAHVDERAQVASRGGERGRATVVFAMLANVGIAVAKGVAFVVTGSAAMLAETAHSVADTTNQGLLLYGLRRSRKAPDAAHPFGYGRERYFWPFVYSVLVFGLGSLVSLWQGVGKLRDPAPVDDPAWAFVVLGAAALMDGASFLNARHQADQVRTGSYWRFIERSRDPEVPVVLLEDSAGVTGVLLAAGAVAASVSFDLHVFDAIGSIAIGLLLAGVAFVLAREMKSLLIGEPATPAQEQCIRDVLEAHQHVEQIVMLRTLHLGPDELLVDAKVRISSAIGADDVALVVDEVERGIRARLGTARIIAVEPDLPEDGDPDLPRYAQEPGRDEPGGQAR